MGNVEAWAVEVGIVAKEAKGDGNVGYSEGRDSNGGDGNRKDSVVVNVELDITVLSPGIRRLLLGSSGFVVGDTWVTATVVA